MADVDEEKRLLESTANEDELEVNEIELSVASEVTSAEQVYTVEEAVERMGFGFFQVILTVFSGLLWLADAMELMLLSVLGPAVKCQWNLSTAEEAAITSVVFVGFLLGGLSWGFVSDNIGRKRVLLIVDIILLVFGVLSAIPVSPGDDKIPGYPWLLFCRFGVGFGAGGTAQAVTYYAEFLPKRARGVCITVLEVWWAIGSMFGALLAYGVMRPGGLGWHWYLGLAAIPLALVLFFFPFVPESARFYVVKGENKKAEKVLRRVAFYNFKEPLLGRIVTLEEQERLLSSREPISNEVLYSASHGGSVTIEKSALHEGVPNGQLETNPLMSDGEGTSSSSSESQAVKSLTSPEVSSKSVNRLHDFRDALVVKVAPMFRNNMWKTTNLLFLIWFVCAWLYYGVVLLTTSFLQYDPHCGINLAFNLTCEEAELTPDEYLKILWTAAAELPGLLITLVLVEIIGRKLTMASEFLLTMLCFLLLFICASQTVITLFLFLIRAFVTGVFQAVYVYTPEVYPTSVRALSLGVHTAAARVGAIVTPYMAQVLLHVSDYATISIYAVSALLVAIASLILPIETKGRSLTDEG